MVKGGLPESVVVSTIQSRPAKFEYSPDGLLALHKAGVYARRNERHHGRVGHRALIVGNTLPRHEGGGPDQSSAMPPSKSRMPRVMVTQGDSTQELKLEKTQLADQNETFIDEDPGSRFCCDPGYAGRD